MNSVLSITWEGAWKLAFGALVIAAGLASTFYSSRSNFSVAELMNVLTLGMVVSWCTTTKFPSASTAIQDRRQHSPGGV